MSHLESAKHDLIQKDEEFRSLYEEHRAFKERLDSIRIKSLLSENDEIEMKKIKLHKLTLKDKMESILRDHMRAGVSV